MKQNNDSNQAEKSSLKERTLYGWFVIDHGAHPLDKSQKLKTLWGLSSTLPDGTNGGSPTDEYWISTSAVYSLHLEEGFAITQNTKYWLKGEGEEIELPLEAISKLRQGLDPRALLKFGFKNVNVIKPEG